ncbi:MAG: hypothetical protein IKD09_07380, partial [Lentisphaeria bacterium]|nr:hypothetical protein [Lentisphaeria bacterium]
MFKFRIISFPLLLALFGYMIFGGDNGALVFNIFAPLMIAMAVYELLAMLNQAGVKSFPKIGGVIALLIAISKTFSFFSICMYLS